MDGEIRGTSNSGRGSSGDLYLKKGSGNQIPIFTDRERYGLLNIDAPDFSLLIGIVVFIIVRLFRHADQ